MSLVPGTRFGPYEVLAPLGAGGMGEVYSARDTKLDRAVALKVLPAAFARDAERVARFRREAYILASLNHPHIGAIHGVEESGDTRALVLELVEGPTLMDRLTHGPLPLDEALAIARQIADALEAAHALGIVHRDLKPSNVKVREDGTVKVLDFGLAKAMEPEATASDLMSSPTQPAGGTTRAGVILGTAPYMSPEQARGKPVDKRTDIWSFGCMLFEMLTGRLAFAGETTTDVLTAVIAREPDWEALSRVAPTRIRGLVRRCLRKDPRERLRDIGDARIEIDEAEREPADPVLASDAPRPYGWGRRDRIVTLAAGVVLGSLGAYGIGLRLRGPIVSSTASSSALAIHSVIDLPAEAPLALGSGVPLIGYDSLGVAVSSDGSRIAYVGRSGGDSRLFVRDLSGLDVKPIPGTEGAIHPFFSPDGRWIGFLTNDKVKKVSLRGGAPVTLCDAQSPERATWTRDDLIYFLADESVLWSVPASRGAPREIARFPGAGNAYRFSQMLPDGKSALMTDKKIGTSADYADVVLMSIESGQGKVLVSSGYDARYVPPGYLLFARAGGLLAVRFDASRGQVLGEPVTVATGVRMDSFFSQAQVAVSDHGPLIYVPGGDRVRGRLALVGQKGETEFLDAPERLYGAVALAPAGDRLAVHVADVKGHIWIYDLQRREGRKLLAAESAGWPVWSADGRRITFTRPGEGTIWTQAVAGGEPPVQIVSDLAARASSWSPDGEVLALYSYGGDREQLGFARLGEKVEWVHNANADHVMPSFSPDGRWVAYGSNEGRAREIWVRSYPDRKTIRQVSIDGGIEPVWCRNGELFYRKGDRWMSARMSLQPELSWEPPRLAFETDFIDTPGRSYDVTPDGRRLLVVKRSERETLAKIHLVSNWLDVFERRESGASAP